MRQAARVILIEDGKILVMHRNKYGSDYYTLVGGRVNDGETPEQALVREVKEETGLIITAARPVFVEEHPAPYNAQVIFLCDIAPHGEAKVQNDSEEGMMNSLGANMHQPEWVHVDTFAKLQFRTPQLQAAIVKALQHGFPSEPEKL